MAVLIRHPVTGRTALVSPSAVHVHTGAGWEVVDDDAPADQAIAHAPSHTHDDPTRSDLAPEDDTESQED